jgi:hypothetical protein
LHTIQQALTLYKRHDISLREVTDAIDAILILLKHPSKDWLEEMDSVWIDLESVNNFLITHRENELVDKVVDTAIKRLESLIDQELAKYEETSHHRH